MSGGARGGEPALLMDDVSFSYAGGHSGAGVAGISLSLRAGEVALLCGRSGCGKTTVTRLANGLAPHFYEGTGTGAVRVCGLDVTHAELWETARLVGSVFQNPKSQFYNVDVRGEVAFGCENLGFDPADIEQRVFAASRAFDLEPLLDASLFVLSGGQKQRVACASAAATSPRLIVLDEPSSNLDFETIARLRAAIARWKEQGTAVLVAEHRIHYLDGLADQVIYLDEGCVAHRWSGEEFARLDDAERVRLGLRARSVADALRFPESARCASSVLRRPGDASADQTPRKLPEPETPPIRFENLTAEYRKNGIFARALDVPSLELPRTSVTALIGPCGAGKSTFAEAVCGLNRCGGLVKIDGALLKRRSRQRRCFMVMQDVNHQLFAESVLDEVLLGMMGDGREQRALDILRDLDLDELAQAHPLSLSGGQRQRVAIAQALATDRPLIVYDEPTSGLDLSHMRQVAETIRHVRDRGAAQIVITHDPELVLSCCTHVAAMWGGRVADVFPLCEETVGRLASLFLARERAGQSPAMEGRPASSPQQAERTLS